MSGFAPTSAFVEYSPSEVDLDLAYLAARHGCTTGMLAALVPALGARDAHRPFSAEDAPAVLLPLQPSQLADAGEERECNHADLDAFCRAESGRRTRRFAGTLTASDVWDDPRNAAFRRRQLELYVTRNPSRFGGDAEARRTAITDLVTSVDRAPGAFALPEVASVTVPGGFLRATRVVPAAAARVATVQLDPPWVTWLLVEIAVMRERTSELQRLNAAVRDAKRAHVPLGAAVKRLHDLVSTMNALGARHGRSRYHLDLVLTRLGAVAGRVCGDARGSVFADARRDLLAAREGAATALFERTASGALLGVLASLGSWASRPVRASGRSIPLLLAAVEALTNALTQVAVDPHHTDAVAARMRSALRALRTQAPVAHDPLERASVMLHDVTPAPGPFTLPEPVSASAVPDTAQTTAARYEQALGLITSTFAEFEGPPSLATHLLTVIALVSGNAPSTLLAGRGAGARPSLTQAVEDWAGAVAGASPATRAALEGPLKRLDAAEIHTLRGQIEALRERRDLSIARNAPAYRALNGALLLLNVCSMTAFLLDAVGDPPSVRRASWVQMASGTGANVASGVLTFAMQPGADVTDLEAYLQQMSQRWQGGALSLRSPWIPSAFTVVSAAATAYHGYLTFREGESTGAFVDWVTAAATAATLAPPPFDLFAAAMLAAGAVAGTNPRFWQEVRHPEPAWHVAWSLVDTLWNHADVVTLRDREAPPAVVADLVALRASLDELAGATFPEFPPGDPARSDAWNALRTKGFSDVERSFILGPSLAPIVHAPAPTEPLPSVP